MNSEYMTDIPKRAIALGMFDSVHIGHRRILNSVTEIKGCIPSVFTFSANSVMRKHGQDYKFVYTDEQKLSIMKKLGISEVFSEDFSEVCLLSGEEFVSGILKKRLNAEYIVCGEDYRFGHNASCGISELKMLGEKYSIKVCVTDAVYSGGEKVSSTLIKKMLTDGRVKEASQLLGGNYYISQTVTEGNRIGRTIDFPTINQNFCENQLIPAFGVYCSKTTVCGREYASVTNIGVKPTVERDIKPLAETHILDFSGDLYGETAEVSLINFIRGERKFAGIDELKKQISDDIKEAEKPSYQTSEICRYKMR
ncbi:MAG: bifunctional riboflavin kinase/FAD synthetase [Ruminococcus sp.]|nr:bifunctional riboflavin kinase/FAD synthetase [Ruminococcus sp.]